LAVAGTGLFLFFVLMLGTSAACTAYPSLDPFNIILVFFLIVRPVNETCLTKTVKIHFSHGQTGLFFFH
jgi:hypothetical protein